MEYHYTIDYIKVVGMMEVSATFHTYALTDEQAINDLYNCIPDVLSGSVTMKLRAPVGARRSL